ncbi:MAG: hypothetical protein N3E37_04125, partial [Candidatus Micrarchaeota archaeon]|nr:hypothetical protein [Candidatus Micrarchaeota archaeon]
MKKTVIPTLNKKSYPITTFSLCLFILILYFIIFLTSLSFSQRISNSGFDKQSVLVLSVIKKSDPYDSVNDIRKIDIVGFYMDVSGYVQYKDSINTHPATSSQQQGNVVQGTHTVGPGVPNVNTQVNPLSNTNVKVYYFDEGLGSSIYLTTITLDANGMGSFDLGNVNSFPKNCRTYIFQVESTNLYDGTIEKVDVCKITSDMIDFRQTLVDYFNNNPTSVFACVSAFILLGVLFAFAFSSGVNPLRFWDINTPRLPKAKIPRINRLPMMGGFWELTKRFRDNIKTFIKMRETYRNRANEIRSEIRDNIRRLNSKLAEVNQRIAAGQGTADLKKLRKQLQKEIREENERLRDLERIVHKLDRASLLLTILSFLEIGTKKEDGISWTALYWLKMRAALGDRAAREILTEWKRLKQTGNIANLKSQNFRALLKQSFDAELNALALLIERMERAGRRRSKLLNLVDESLRGNQVGSQLDKLNRAKTAVREVDREYHKLRDIINRLDNEISNIINNNSRAAQRWEINAYRGQSSYNSLEEAQNALKQFHVDQQNFKYTYLANIHKTNVDKIDINQVPDVATLEEISRRLRGEKTAILELETIRRELMFMGSMFTEYSSAELQKMRLIYENTFGGILGALYSMPVFGKVFEGFSYYSIWGVGSSLLAVRGIGEMFLSPIVGLSIFVNRFGWYRNSINRVIDAHTNFLNILTSIANNQNLNPILRKFASSYVVAYPKVTELIHSLLYAKDVGFVKARDIKIGHVLDPDQKVATETVRNHDQILGLLSRDLIEHLERDLNNINDPNLREQVRKIIESYRARDNEGLRTTTNTESLVNETTRLINLIGSHNRELANRIIELRDFYNGSNNLVNEVKNLRTDGVTRQNKLMELRALIENNEQLKQYRAVIKALYHMKLLAEPSLLENWLLFSQDERNVGIIENETTRSRMQIGEAGREMRELIENTLRAEFERLMNARNTRNPNDIIGTREFNENILERAGAELFSILSRIVIVDYLAVEMPNV